MRGKPSLFISILRQARALSCALVWFALPQLAHADPGPFNSFIHFTGSSSAWINLSHTDDVYWWSSTDAVNYVVLISSTSDCNSIVYTDYSAGNYIELNSGNIADGGPYYACVRAIDGSNAFTVSVDSPLEFYVDATRPTISFSAPSDSTVISSDTTTYTITVSYGGNAPAGTGINENVFYVNQQDGSITCDQDLQLDNTDTSGGVTTKTYTFEVSNCTGDGKFNVAAAQGAAADEANNQSDFTTSTDSVYVLNSGPAPFYMKGVDGTLWSSSATPSFEWDPAIGAVSYSVTIANDSGCSSVIESSTQAGTTYTVGTTLDLNTEYFLCLSASDGNGGTRNVNGSPISIKFDTTPPVFTIDNGPFPLTINSSQTSVYEGTLTEAGGSFIGGADDEFVSIDYTGDAECTGFNLVGDDDNMTFDGVTLVMPLDIEISNCTGNGTFKFHFTDAFYDGAGNHASPSADSGTLNIVNYAADAFLILHESTDLGGVWTNSATPTIEWSEVDNTASYEIKIDDTAGCVSPLETSTETGTSYVVTGPLMAGVNYYICLTADDGLGGITTAENNGVLLKRDATKPILTIDSGPSLDPVDSSQKTTFTATLVEAGGSFLGSNGSNDFFDVSATGDAVCATIDLLGDDNNLTWDGNTLTFPLTVDFSDCTGTGTIQFKFKAGAVDDGAGNFNDDSSYSNTFTVNNGGGTPGNFWINNTSAWLNDDTPEFTWDVGGATYEIKIDDNNGCPSPFESSSGSWQTYTVSTTLTEDTPYYVCLNADDGNGNITVPQNDNHEFRVDVTKPVITFGAPTDALITDGETNTLSATVVEAGGSSLDDGPDALTLNYTGTAECDLSSNVDSYDNTNGVETIEATISFENCVGNGTVELESVSGGFIDVAGNTSDQVIATDFSVNAAILGAFSISTATSWFNTVNPMLEWDTSTGADWYNVSINNASGCGSQIESNTTTSAWYTVGNSLSEGTTYYLCVTAERTEGDTLAASNDDYSFQIDVTAPTVVIASGPTNATINAAGSTAFTLTLDDGSGSGLAAGTEITSGHITQVTTGGATCSTIQVTNGTTTSPTVTLSDCSGNGTVKIQVNAAAIQDAVANASDASAESSPFTVTSSSGPGSFNITAPNAWINDTTPEIEWDAATDADTYTVKIDDTSGCGSPVEDSVDQAGTSYTVSGALTPGTTYYVCVTAKNGLGTTAATNDNYSFEIDTTKPTATISAGPTVATVGGSDSTAFTVDLADTGGSDLVGGYALINSEITLVKTGSADCSTIQVTNGTTASATVTVSGCTGDGTVKIQVNASAIADVAGNTSDASAESTLFTVDNTGPDAFNITAPGAWTNDTTPLVEWDAATGASAYTVKVDDTSGCGSAIETSTDQAGTTYTVSGALSAGTTYYVCVTAKDAQGNTTAATNNNYSFQIDTTKPTVSMTSGPTNATIGGAGSTQYTVTLADTGGSGLVGGYELTDAEITLVKTGSADCSTIQVADGTTTTPDVTLSDCTGDGTVKIKVNASAIADAAGNVNDESAESSAVTIDSTGPDAFDITGPDAWTNDTTPLVEWDASTGASTYTVKVDDTSGCGSALETSTDQAGTTYTVSGALSAGTTYYVCVTAKDAQGNTTAATNNNYSFEIDTTKPTVSMTSGPTNATIGGAGSTQYTVTLVDTGGSGLVGGYELTNAEITLVKTGSADCSTIQVADGTTTTPDITLSDCTGDGTVKIKVNASAIADAAGNVNDESAESGAVTIDSTGPDAFDITAPDAWTNDTTPDLTWDASTGASTYTVKVDDTSGCGSALETSTDQAGTSYTVSGALSAGTTYYVCVTAKDAQGNTTAATNNNYSFEIDTTKPTVSMTSGPTNATIGGAGSTQYTVTLADTGGSGLVGGYELTNAEITLVKTGSADCSTIQVADGTTTTPDITLSDCTGDGTVKIKVNASAIADAAGNVNDESAESGAVTIDSTGPDAFDITAPDAWTNDTTPTITWDVATGASTYTVKVDDTSGCGSPVEDSVDQAGTSFTVSGALTPGTTYYVCVTAKDAQGNTTAATNDNYSFEIETTQPTTTISAGPTVATVGGSDSTEFTVDLADTGGSGLVVGYELTNAEITLVKTGSADCSTIQITNGTTASATVNVSGCTGDGTVKIKVNASAIADAAGNVNDASAESTLFTVDSTGPDVFAITAPASWTNDTTPDITWGGSTGASTYTVKVDDTSGCGSPVEDSVDQAGTSFTVSGALTPGTTYYVCVTAKDAQGNTTDASNNNMSFGIDTTEPEVDITAGPTVATVSQSDTTEYTIDITESGGSDIATSDIVAASDVTLTGTASCQVNATPGTPNVAGGTTTLTITLEFSNCTGDGTVKFKFNAGAVEDGAGNQSVATSDSSIFTVDNTGSDPFNITAPDTWTNDTTPQIEWDASTGAVTYTVKVDDTSGCASPVEDSVDQAGTTYVVSGALTPGTTYYVCVTAKDAVGNITTATNNNYSFEIDTTKPTATVSAGPTNATVGTSDSTEFTVGLADTGGSGLVGGYELTNAEITLVKTGSADCSTIQVDDGTTSTATVTLSGCTGDGTVKIKVNASAIADAAGNVNDASAESTLFTVDSTGPDAFDITAPDVWTNDTTPQIEWDTATGAVNYTVKVDDTSGCGSPIEDSVDQAGVTYSVSGALSAGTTYYVCVTAKDAVGNTTTATNNSYSFEIDTTQPTATVSAGPTVATVGSSDSTEFTVDLADTGGSSLLVGYELTDTEITLVKTGSADCSTIQVTNGTTASATVNVSGCTGDGTVKIKVNASAIADTAGNLNDASAESTLFTVDSTGPDAFDITAPEAWTNDTTPLIEWDVANGAVTYTVKVDDTSGCGSPIEDSVDQAGTTFTPAALAAGSYYVCVTAKDAQGNTTQATNTNYNFQIETTKPTAAVTAGPSNATIGPSGSTQFTVTLADTGGSGLVAGYELTDAEITLVKTGSADCTTIQVADGTTATPDVTLSDCTGDGTIKIKVNASAIADTAGNLNDESAESTLFTVDSTGPDPFNITDPEVWTNDTTPQIEWDASTGAATYTVKVDDTSGCGSALETSTDQAGTTYTVSGALSAGTTYYVCVIAKDAQGNTTVATNNNYSFEIDTTNPTATVSAGPTVATVGASDSTEFTVDLADTGGSALAAGYELVDTEITLVKTGSADCSTIQITNGTTASATVNISGCTGDGTIKIKVNASAIADTAGNLNDESAESTLFTVHTSAPAAFTITAPNAWTNDTTPTITWGASAGATTYTVKVDDTSGCASPIEDSVDQAGTSFTVSGALTPGTTYYVCVTAKDGVGNTTAATNDNMSFEIDDTKPVVGITGPTTATVTNSDTTEYTVDITEDGGSDISTSDILAVSDVVSTGTANCDINATPGTPNTVGTTTTLDITVEFSNCSGDGTVKFKFNAGSVVDGAGNQSDATAYSTIFTVDNSGPGAFNITAPTTWTNDATPDVEWDTATDASTYTVKIDDTSGCASPLETSADQAGATFTAAALAEGSYYACVTAKDAFGNITAATNNNYSFGVDLTQPTATVTAGPTNVLVGVGDSTEFTVALVDTGGSGLVTAYELTIAEITLVKTGSADCATIAVDDGTTATATVRLSDCTGNGTVKIKVAASALADNAGNVSDESAESTDFTVDSTSPLAFEITAPTSWTNDSTPDIVWDASTNADQYDVKVDDTSGCASPVDSSDDQVGTIFTSSALTEGTYYVCVTAEKAGGGSPRAADNDNMSFGVDLTNPTGSPGNLSAGGTHANNTSVTFAWDAGTCADALSGVAAGKYYVTIGTTDGDDDKFGGEVTATTKNVTCNDTETCYARVHCVDDAGNYDASTYASSNILVDTQVPGLTSILRENPMPQTVPNGTTSVRWLVTFDKVMEESTFAAGDFEITTVTGSFSDDGTSSLTIEPKAGAGNDDDEFYVDISGVAGSGELRLDFKSGGSVTDLAGNAYTTATTSGETYIFDQTAPSGMLLYSLAQNVTRGTFPGYYTSSNVYSTGITYAMTTLEKHKFEWTLSAPSNRPDHYIIQIDDGASPNWSALVYDSDAETTNVADDGSSTDFTFDGVTAAMADLTDGIYSVRVIAVDDVGNTSTSNVIQFVVDTEAPTWSSIGISSTVILGNGAVDVSWVNDATDAGMTDAGAADTKIHYMLYMATDAADLDMDNTVTPSEILAADSTGVRLNPSDTAANPYHLTGLGTARRYVIVRAVDLLGNAQFTGTEDADLRVYTIDPVGPLSALELTDDSMVDITTSHSTDRASVTVTMEEITNANANDKYLIYISKTSEDHRFAYCDAVTHEVHDERLNTVVADRDDIEATFDADISAANVSWEDPDIQCDVDGTNGTATPCVIAVAANDGDLVDNGSTVSYRMPEGLFKHSPATTYYVSVRTAIYKDFLGDADTADMCNYSVSRTDIDADADQELSVTTRNEKPVVTDGTNSNKTLTPTYVVTYDLQGAVDYATFTVDFCAVDPNGGVENLILDTGAGQVQFKHDRSGGWKNFDNSAITAIFDVGGDDRQILKDTTGSAKPGQISNTACNTDITKRVRMSWVVHPDDVDVQSGFSAVATPNLQFRFRIYDTETSDDTTPRFYSANNGSYSSYAVTPAIFTVSPPVKGRGSGGINGAAASFACGSVLRKDSEKTQVPWASLMTILLPAFYVYGSNRRRIYAKS